jgi:hypothetical protein
VYATDILTKEDKRIRGNENIILLIALTIQVFRSEASRCARKVIHGHRKRWTGFETAIT